MKKLLKSSLLLVCLFFIVVFWFSKEAQAIANVCKNPALYEVGLNISPGSGDVNTLINLQPTFKWNSTALDTCVNNNLQFDLNYRLNNANIYQNITEIAFGAPARGELVTRSQSVSPNSLPNLSQIPRNNDIIHFYLVVEGDDLTDEGDDLFSNYIEKSFTVRVGSQICAYVDPGDGKWACIPGSESATNCSTVSACSGKNCTRIDSTKCGSVASYRTCQNNACVQVQGSGTDSCTTNANCAAGGPGPGATTSYTFTIQPPSNIQTFQDLISVIGQWIFNLAIPIAVIMIIWAGVLMLTSGGKPEQFRKGMSALKYAVIGLAIILIGKGFVSLIKSILDIAN